MLMLAPPRYELIEHCDQFTAYVGGSEANVAIGLERLGMHAGWIGKLRDNVLGRKIVNGIRAHGVDTSACIWAGEGRVGVFFVEWGVHPRPVRTIYDRAGSSAATLTPKDIDWGYVGRAEWLLMTGITPALSEGCCRSAPEIARRARELDCKVCFDVNYRSLLWPAEEACAACRKILPHVNICVATETDAAMLAGEELEAGDLAMKLCNTWELEAAVVTCGVEGSAAFDGTQRLRSEGYDVQVVNRIGAGDAFDAGLLYGYITADLRAGLEIGSAMAALKMTIPQNIPLVELTDIQSLLSGRDTSLIR